MIEPDERNSQIRAIWREYRFFYQVLGGLILVGFGVFIGAIWFSTPADRNSYIINLYTSILSIIVTVFVIDLLNRRRDERRANEREKSRLKRQMGSRINAEAIRAIEELEGNDWLRDGSLNGINLDEADLTDAKLDFASLYNAQMFSTNLSHATLTDANLQHIRCMNANFKQARLHGANLREAKIFYSSLYGADLADADLRGADLRETDLRHIMLQTVAYLPKDGNTKTFEPMSVAARFDETTVLPDGTQWTPETDLQRFVDPEHPNFWRSKSGFGVW